jgi:DNA-damage-inducible protein J
MAKTSSLNIRISPETKKGAEQLFSSFGITVTDAVNMFLHQSLMVGGLPFELKQPRYNATTEAALQEARDMMAGKVSTKTYGSVAEMNADIDSMPDEE